MFLKSCRLCIMKTHLSPAISAAIGSISKQNRASHKYKAKPDSTCQRDQSLLGSANPKTRGGGEGTWCAGYTSFIKSASTLTRTIRVLGEQTRTREWRDTNALEAIVVFTVAGYDVDSG